MSTFDAARTATLGVLAVWGTVSSAAGCTEIGTDPAAAVAIEFDSLPFPSVVIGDTLRDTTGAPAPLRARAFNYKGELIPDATISFVTRDTNATITATGLLVAKSTATGQIPLFATVGTLQSLVLNVAPVPRPDTLRAAGTPDDLEYGPAVSPDSVKFSDTLFVSLGSKSTAGSIAPVPSYLVTFLLRYDGRDVPPGDTAVVALVSEAGVFSVVDTTAPDGRAARRVRVRTSGLRAAIDSVIVFATARYGRAAAGGSGAHVAGSPVRFVLHLRRRSS